MIIARADERWKLRHVIEALDEQPSMFRYRIEERAEDILWGELPWVLIRELKPCPSREDLEASSDVPIDLSDFEAVA